MSVVTSRFFPVADSQLRTHFPPLSSAAAAALLLLLTRWTQRRSQLRSTSGRESPQLGCSVIHTPRFAGELDSMCHLFGKKLSRVANGGCGREVGKPCRPKAERPGPRARVTE